MMRFISILVMLSVAGVAFFWYTKPTYDDIQRIRGNTEQYDQALARARELQELRQSLLSRYNTFPGAQLDRLERLLPDHVDNVRLVLDLDNMAISHNMAMQNIEVAREREDSDNRTAIGALESESTAIDSRILEFVAQGSYPDFVRFMADLESSLRLVDLVSLTIDGISTQDGNAEPRYNFTVAVRTYWLR